MPCASANEVPATSGGGRFEQCDWHPERFILNGEKMAAMMILMLVLLVAPGAGGHMGAHGANDASPQSSQTHVRDAAKTDTAEP